MTLDNQLERLAERGPVADPRFVVRRVLEDAPRLDRSDTAVYRVHAAPRRRPSRLLVAVVVLLLVTGMAALVATRDRGNAPATGAPPISPAEAPAVPVEPPRRLLLDTELNADEQPLVIFNRPGWTLDTFNGFTPSSVEPVVGSAACPGCGEPRLIVASDGPLLSGGLFTAWVLTDAYSLIGQLDTPVEIWDGLAGGASASPEGTPLEQSWTTLAWAIADGPGAPIAIVDARGVPYDQVVAMAKSLTFQQTIDLPEAPAGMRVVSRPESSVLRTETAVISFTDTWKGLTVFATNGGVQSLFDWQHSALGDVIGGDWEPRTIGGTTVAFDWGDDKDVG